MPIKCQWLFLEVNDADLDERTWRENTAYLIPALDVKLCLDNAAQRMGLRIDAY